MYGTLLEFCTPENCPTMSAGPKYGLRPYKCFFSLLGTYGVIFVLIRYEYRWADGVTIKKPIEVSAPKYVEYLMDWIDRQLDDEAIFPQAIGELSFHLLPSSFFSPIIIRYLCLCFLFFFFLFITWYCMPNKYTYILFFPKSAPFFLIDRIS